MPTEVKPNPEFSKVMREAIYFSNSLEREALKLILKDNSFQRLTLFSVLSYIAEINSGAKRSPPYGLDCGKFKVVREGKIIKVFKACVKPITEIARIQTTEEDKLFEVEFPIKEWANVVGLSVTLTGENLRCQLRIADKKLYGLRCHNWSYQTDSDQFSATVIKAKDFVFQRDAKKQFIIRGGFYKELIENKKIDILIPLEGKIKIIEKELRVIDEFANKINQESRVKHEGEEAYKKHISEESTKKISEDNSQEGRPAENSPSQTPEGQPEEPVESGPEIVPKDSRGGRGR